MKSIWQNGVTPKEFPKLEGDASTDVLIIGGGITGLLTAYALHNAGVNCILVEKNRVCGGTTGHTTAKLTYQHGLIYGKLLRQYGTERAKAYLDANRLAFERFSELCRHIDCDYEIKDNFVYSTDDPDALEEEMRALDRIGYSAILKDRLPLPIKTAGAVCFREQAQFHPLKLLSHVWSELNIFEQTPVLNVKGRKALTDTGVITAKHIVVATHFPFINRHGAYFLKLYQHRSYVIALKNAEILDGMYVDESKTGLSFRNYKDLLLLGGGGHRTGNKGGGYAELRMLAAKNYPRSAEVCGWAAQDCMSLDGIPYIGRYSSNDSALLVATGFNKWGMTGSMLASELLSDIILEKKNQFLPLFDPSRSILKPQLLINGAETAKNLLTPFGKRCTHLGCRLKWNNAEHTWDCACHGSRFSCSGDVLDSPAQKRLDV